MIPTHIPLVTTTRGSTVEAVHWGSIAIVDEKGRLVASAGDPDALNFTRSSLKPLQALPFVRDGGLQHWGFGDRELAVMCASHSGEPSHVEVVSAMLRRIGTDESALQCGCHTPIFYSAVGKTPPQDATWCELHHNCSGKHAGFLAYCRMHGDPIAQYLTPESRIQSRIAATVREYAGSAEVARGIDGCSAPNYAMPLSRLAYAFCRLAIGETPEEATISRAMRAHPYLVSGAARFDDAIMKAGNGDWLSKAGAQGVHAVGIESSRIGIAVRIADGDQHAVWSVVLRVMQELGILGEVEGTLLAPFVRNRLTNLRGIHVGSVETVFALKYM